MSRDTEPRTGKLPPEIEETGNRDLETGVLYSSSSLLLNYSLSFSCLELPSPKQTHLALHLIFSQISCLVRCRSKLF
ncbi:hypothetical protein MRB53_033867 [Persea americana]|uniref:Uncharacterized protein n=1 Tax=Persea americana TaxID=3435 RepID=A0ACC2KWX0_PERAE|nr:hypothetical protein MRB53_033867 [Persea americana]